MPRITSRIAAGWWDYTTLDPAILRDAAALTPSQMQGLSRAGFQVVFYDTLEDFYLAEALEYIDCLAAGDARPPGGHLRPDRADGAAAAGGAPGERPRPATPERAFLGHGRMGARRERGP